ncbi:amidase, partial [bacterium]
MPNLEATHPHEELTEITIAQLQAKMQSGEETAKSLVEKYLDRIRTIDPQISSVIELNPDAHIIALNLDRERKEGNLRGPLHGIPVLIKDNIDTHDKMHTTAGSLALLEAPTPAQDAFIVQLLRNAGAVIIGKTNLSEWANFRSTKSISGWSGRGGQTNNPYILDRNPCGSSSGTGAAISANLAAVGVGTETNGSIICPSLKCGLVGIKPTLGLVSRSGIIPIAHTQDTAGPMTRTVTDAAILLGALVGNDPADPITAHSISGHTDYTQFLNADGLNGARIGIARQFFGDNEQVNALLESHLQLLVNAGATLIDVTFTIPDNFWDDEHEVLLCEFKADLNQYLAARHAPYKNLAEVIQFNEDNKDREMPLFEQELFQQAQQKADLQNDAYRQALHRLKLATQEQGIDAIMANHNLNAIVSLSGGGTWSLSAIAGYPHITVPAGFSEGLPIGLGFFGRAFSEPQLIKYAYAFEL